MTAKAKAMFLLMSEYCNKAQAKTVLSCQADLPF